MPDRVLTQRELNRAVLARQHLLERSPLPLTDVLEAVAGLQTQYAPAGYIGLWSRLVDFRRPTLTEALVGRRAIQATVMRATIHVVSAADYWPFAIATRPARAEWYLRAARTTLDGVDLEAAAERLRSELSDGPVRHDELVRRLEAAGVPRATWNGLAQLVDLVRVPPSGTWEQRRANLYGLAETWLPRPALDETTARVHLVRRYLAGFGPASRADVVSWTGLSAGVVRSTLADLELRRFRDEDGRELLDVPDAPLPEPATPAPIRFLPNWDANLLVHARRTGILPEPYRPRIFHTKAPQSFATFLVDGAVAGTWRWDDGRIRLDPFDAIAPRDQRALDEETERLAAWFAA
jgi:hypothetical protein